MEWINVKDELPKGKQEVLGYWGEEDGEEIVPFYTVFTYYKKGDFIAYGENKDIESGLERLIDSIANPDNMQYAEEDGFYFYPSESLGTMQRHSDIITHWMLLAPPAE